MYSNQGPVWVTRQLPQASRSVPIETASGARRNGFCRGTETAKDCCNTIPSKARGHLSSSRCTLHRARHKSPTHAPMRRRASRGNFGPHPSAPVKRRRLTGSQGGEAARRRMGRGGGDVGRVGRRSGSRKRRGRGRRPGRGASWDCRSSAGVREGGGEGAAGEGE